jgi:hypothetical protein
MSLDNAVIRLRLSASQISAIWPGLDRIVRSYSSYCSSQDWPYSYPFRLYPPPPGFKRGTFDSDLMSEIVALWRRLQSKAQRGGRMQMNANEVRAATLAVRVDSDWWRYQKHRRRKNTARAKQFVGVDPKTLSQLRERAHRTIQSLERHTKRASRRLLSIVGQDAYDALMFAWRAHVKWMRLHVVYFRPRRPIIKAGKKRYQIILDDLEKMAREALRQEGYQEPAEGELRRVMRLFTRSSRRGRRGALDIPYMLNYRQDRFAKSRLADFVLIRLSLPRLPEG